MAFVIRKVIVRLDAESSSRPLPLFSAAWRPHLLYPLCEGGGELKLVGEREQVEREGEGL